MIEIVAASSDLVPICEAEPSNTTGILLQPPVDDAKMEQSPPLEDGSQSHATRIKYLSQASSDVERDRSVQTVLARPQPFVEEEPGSLLAHSARDSFVHGSTETVSDGAEPDADLLNNTEGDDRMQVDDEEIVSPMPDSIETNTELGLGSNIGRKRSGRSSATANSNVSAESMYVQHLT